MNNKGAGRVCLGLLAASLHGFVLGAPQTDAANEWINRPWGIRYVLFVDTLFGLQTNRRLATAANRSPNQNSVYLDADELTDPQPIAGTASQGQLGIVVFRFDEKGTAKLGSPPQTWSARITHLERLVFQNPKPKGKPYRFAIWSQGIPGETSFSPAVCGAVDSRRYESGWSNGSLSGGFGCREWTAQLYDSGRPYIDVTAYGPDKPFIGEFVGWARFIDEQKPVIGLHRTTWICIYDCPAGEKPGVIKDIKAWTAKHHFPMPERPPKQPLYPNSDYADSWND